MTKMTLLPCTPAAGHSAVSLPHDGLTARNCTQPSPCLDSVLATHALRRSRHPPVGKRTRFRTFPAKISPTPITVNRSNRSE